VSASDNQQERNVVRYRFDIALRNILRRSTSGASRPVAGADETPPIAPLPNRGRNLLKRIARPLIRPIARKTRRYLVGETELALEALRTKLDFQIISLHHKTDALDRRLDAIARQLGMLTSLTPILNQKLDDVGVHVRGPVRIDDATFAVRTGDGYVFVPESDTQLLLLLMDAGPEGLEPGTRRIIQKLLRPGSKFIDAGAHIGLLTLAAARIVGPAGKITAVEPTPLTSSLLARAIDINGLSDRVRIESKAAGACAGRTEFFIHKVLGHNSSYDKSEDSHRIEVDVISLDELIPAGTHIDLVKIDVEGAELDVLQGMTRILAENPQLSIIAEFGPAHLQWSNHSAADWFGTFAAKGFRAEEIDELTGELTPIRGANYPTRESANILFSRTLPIGI
jgi:FkbM family methyltransferase